MDFKVGDSAVYPGHGVGRIVAIDSKKIMGDDHLFYTLEILESKVKVMVPKQKAQNVGLRHLINEKDFDKMVDVLQEKTVKSDTQTWNRRYREYMDKIKTGSVYEIAEVLRDLFLMKKDKELSFGEKKMMSKAQSLLLKELKQADLQKNIEAKKDIKAFFEN